MHKVQDLTIEVGTKIIDVLRHLNLIGTGICFIVKGKRLEGVVTDGDIRRGLVNGLALDSVVDLVMKKDCFSLPINTGYKEIQQNIIRFEYIPIVNEVGELIDYATQSRYHHIPLVQPVLSGNELEYVTDCILTGWISSQGEYVKRFEKDFSKYVCAQHALAVSNGTVALHLALASLGIGPSDEVIVPDLTFVSPVNAIIYVGAKPVIVDVEASTMALDLKAVKSAITERTKAIVVVHLYGQPANMSDLMTIARQHNLYVIEDCAEALGSHYNNKHVGTFGDAATFSFFGNKTITTGEGGMVLFREEVVYERAKILRDHGMSPERRYWHNDIGFNYRLTNLQAAIGVAQLQKANEFISKKRLLANTYNKYLSKYKEFILPGDHGATTNSYWLYTIVLTKDTCIERDKIIAALRQQGVESRPVFFPIHRMPPYQKYCPCTKNYPVADELSDKGLSLPSSVTITEEEIRFISLIIGDTIDKSAGSR